MKRNGFTIAESLITMAIIGVVAALTMPTFIAGYRKNAFAATLASTVSTLEKAFATSMMKQNANSFYDTDLLQENNTLAFLRKLNIVYSKMQVYSPSLVKLTLKNGADIIFRNITKIDNSARLEEEVLAEGGNLYSIIGLAMIDVNGVAKAPNKEGKDRFSLVIGSDGKLYPPYGRDYAIYLDEEPADFKTECVNNGKLEYCGAYLFENGFKMDY